MRMAIFSLLISIFCILGSLYAAKFYQGHLNFLFYLIIFAAFGANFLNKLRKNLFFPLKEKKCA